MGTPRSKEAAWEAKRKRQYAEASLKNLLEFERKRLQEEAEAQKPAAAKAAGSSGAGTGDAGDEKKTAPDVQKMMSLLYDEVEAGAITSIGVDKDAAWYRESVELLRARVEAELRETMDKVRKTPSWPRSWAKFSLL